jgi:hypothetical protein
MSCSGTPRAHGVLLKLLGTISLAVRDSVPKAVLRSSPSSISKSITSIVIGWFKEERSHNHSQESRWKEKEYPCPNLYPIWNYLYYFRYSELPGRPTGRPRVLACLLGSLSLRCFCTSSSSLQMTLSAPSTSD